MRIEKVQDIRAMLVLMKTTPQSDLASEAITLLRRVEGEIRKTDSALEVMAEQQTREDKATALTIAARSGGLGVSLIGEARDMLNRIADDPDIATRFSEDLEAADHFLETTSQQLRGDVVKGQYLLEFSLAGIEMPTRERGGPTGTVTHVDFINRKRT